MSRPMMKSDVALALAAWVAAITIAALTIMWWLGKHLEGLAK